MMEKIIKSRRRVQEDFDSDGVVEEAVGFLQKVFLNKNGEVVWENVGGGVNLVTKAYDINGDGKKEIIVGGSERKIFVYSDNGEKLKEIRYWSAGDKKAGWVWDIDIDDINGDGKPEILVGGMAAWGGEGIDVKLYDPEFNEIWKYRVPRSALRVRIDDLEGKGEKVAVVMTYDGRVIILDKNGKEKKKTMLGANIVEMDIEDINGDGKKEIIVGSADGELFALTSDLKRMWTEKISDYDIVQVYTIKVDDFNGDGKKEILVTGRRFVGLFDPNGKKILAKDNNILEGDGLKVNLKIDVVEIHTPSGVNKIKMDDWIEAAAIGKTKEKNIIALALLGYNLIVMDEKGNILKEFTSDDGYFAVDIGDANNDGEVEIVAGTSTGRILVYNLEGETLHESKLYGEVSAISVLDIDGDGKNEIIASTKNQADEIMLIKL